MESKVGWFFASTLTLLFYGMLTWLAMTHAPLDPALAVGEAAHRICAGCLVLGLTSLLLAALGYLMFERFSSERLNAFFAIMAGLSVTACLASIVAGGIAWSGSWTGAFPGVILAVVFFLYFALMTVPFSIGWWSMLFVFLALSVGIPLYGYLFWPL